MESLVKEAFSSNTRLSGSPVVDDQNDGIGAELLQLPLHQHLGVRVQWREGFIDQQDTGTPLPQENLPDELHLAALASRQGPIPVLHLLMQLSLRQANLPLRQVVVLAAELQLRCQPGYLLLGPLHLLLWYIVCVTALQQPLERGHIEGAVKLLGDFHDVIRREHKAVQCFDLEACGQHRGMPAAAGQDAKEAALAAAVGAGHRVDAAGSEHELGQLNLRRSPRIPEAGDVDLLPRGLHRACCMTTSTHLRNPR
mmetsp:Transcript_71936/g.204100  ORF Transcript_71936/g.204100 Transcript_71936/m.204100 type:complete len:254 (-) Transcript_71936:22-783(-)